MTTPDPTRLELAITELKGSMDSGMARIEGRLDLLVQRAEHTDQRAADQAAWIQRVDDKVGRVDDRVDIVQATAVTRAEMDEKAKRTLQVMAIIVAVLGTATSAGTALFIAFVVKGG